MRPDYQTVFDAVMEALKVNAPKLGEAARIAVATSAALRVKNRLEKKDDVE